MAAWPGAVLADIDWSQPWFEPWRAIGEPLAHSALQRHSVADALNAWVARPIAESPKSVPRRFVPQTALPEGEAYEAFIAQTHQVPTRDGLHDFFNGLCWARFPQAKQRLNQLQAAEIQRMGIGAQRGPVRDALTLFDENAILLQAPDELWQALQAREWTRLFVTLRAQWSQTHLVLFGHALLEKLVRPYKSITGHVYRIDPAVAGNDTAIDAWLAQSLSAEKLAPKPFEPLPILGVPGWWAANADAAFYDDAQVFRPRRVATHP
jgi:hypothetical protein